MAQLWRTGFTENSEKAAQRSLVSIRQQRKSRFRVLACIDGTEASYDTVRFAKRLTPHDNCDIVIVYVRPIDKGLSGGLNVKLARQNMLDSGVDLPGLRALKHGLKVLREEGLDVDGWERRTESRDAWGDPVGDNKVVFRSKSGRRVVLKLKTAPNAAAGILDQYRYGPYNLIIINEPSRWRGEFRSIFDSGVVQRVTAMAPCSVMVARELSLSHHGMLLYNDGSMKSQQAIKRAAVLGHSISEPMDILAVASHEREEAAAQEQNTKLVNMLSDMGISINSSMTKVGDPVTMINRFGAEKAVIVVPDDGHSAIYRAIWGSTAWGVIKNSVCSVMDVR